MAIEDLTTWTEVDGGGDLTVTSSKIDVVTQANNVTNYVYKSLSLGTADYDHDFECYVSVASTGTPTLFFYGVSTGIATLDVGFSISCYVETGSLTPYITDIDSGGTWTTFTAGSNLTISTLYYCTFKRVGNTATWDIYSDSSRTTLVQSISMAISNNTQSYQYVYAESSYNWADASTFSYYVQNVDLKAPAPSSGIPILRRRIEARAA